MKTRTYSKRDRVAPYVYPPDVRRPRTRGECANGPRPCPFVSCRYHLALDVTSKGSVRLDTRFLRGEMQETCTLDVADNGAHSVQEIADITGLSTSRITQTVDAACARARPAAEKEIER